MALPNIYSGPLDRSLAEQGVYRVGGSPVPRMAGASPGIMPPATNTGGGLQAMAAPTVNTGGGLQAAGVPAVTTGGPNPAVPGNTGIVPPVVHTGGPGQVMPGVPAQPGQPFDVNSILNQLWAGQGGNQPRVDPAALANQYMVSLLGANSPYIQSARQAGLEEANSRGLLNSSIAAGASQRAAVDAAMPMFQAAYGLNSQREQNAFTGALQRTGLGMDLIGQRENNAFQGSQADLQRQFEGQQAQLDRNLKQKLQSDAVYQQDWLSKQDFTRQFNAALSMIPIQTATQFSQLVQQYALENPEVYTPQVISGMQTFFTQTMGSILKQYFPNLK